MAKKSKQIVKQVEATKPVFKSRYAGLIKLDEQNNLPEARIRLIEGEQFIEFKGLEGVYFSNKLFI